MKKEIESNTWRKTLQYTPTFAEVHGPSKGYLLSWAAMYIPPLRIQPSVTIVARSLSGRDGESRRYKGED